MEIKKNTPGIFVAIESFDKNGKRLGETKQKGNSWLNNFLNLLLTQFAPGEREVTDYTGTDREIRSYYAAFGSLVPWQTGDTKMHIALGNGGPGSGGSALFGYLCSAPVETVEKDGSKITIVGEITIPSDNEITETGLKFEKALDIDKNEFGFYIERTHLDKYVDVEKDGIVIVTYTLE